jgi:sporulation integral membrane protein YtvI
LITFYQKYWRTVFDIALLVLTVYLFMWAFTYLYKIATPIFLAFLIFAMIEPLAGFLHRKKFPKMLATTISLLLFITIILGALIGSGIVFTNQVMNLIVKIETYTFTFQDEATYLLQDVIGRLNALPADYMEKLKELASMSIEKASGFMLNFLKGLVSGLSSVSTFILNFAIGLILAFFLSIEIDNWRKIAKEKTPKTFKAIFNFLRENVIKGILSYAKAQLILISITFVIIFISLLVLDVKNAFSISLLAAVFDLLPLLGVSTIFIPWLIYLFIVGDTTLALWLSGLYLVILVTRQVLEPKITGQSLGVSAFTMLSFMIISLSLFGIIGLIISPILVITIKALMDQGYLKLWIRRPEEEYPAD